MGLRVVDRRDFIPRVPQGKEWAERADRLPRTYISIYNTKGLEQGAFTCNKLERLGHKLVFVVRHFDER